MAEIEHLQELALSIRQPYAWAIIHAWKDIENRTWRTLHRGRIAIHAAKGMTNDEWRYAAAFIWRLGHLVKCPAPICLDRGGIIGSVELVDVVTASDSPWFEGPYGLALHDPQPCDFIPARGALGVFRWNSQQG